MNHKIWIISQARMTSTRLPGKVLKAAAGKPLLQWHLERLRKSGLPVAVATTTNETDQPIVHLCDQLQIPSFRGDEMDVLDRYYGAAQKFEAAHVVRVTSDCPLIDGELIKSAVHQYFERNSNQIYFSNCLERTFPRGLDFEIFSFDLLKRAHHEAHEKAEREHVTPWIRSHLPSTQKINLTSQQDLSSWRLTVDEADDFELIRRLLEDHHAGELSFDQIAEVLRNHPELCKINSHVEQKKT